MTSMMRSRVAFPLSSASAMVIVFQMEPARRRRLDAVEALGIALLGWPGRVDARERGGGHHLARLDVHDEACRPFDS